MESLGLKPVTDMLKYLGLPGSVPTENAIKFFNFTNTLALIQYHTEISDLILNVVISRNPKNSSLQILMVSIFKIL